jgi:hypothetical protein
MTESAGWPQIVDEPAGAEEQAAVSRRFIGRPT